MIGLYLLFKLVSLTAFMVCLTQLKYSKIKSYGVIISAVFVIWIVNFSLLIFKGENFSNYIYPLTVSVPILFCFLLLSKKNRLKVLFSFLNVCNFGMFVSYIGIFVAIIFNNIALQIFVEFLCFVLIIVIILKKIRKPYFKILDTLDKGWGVLCAVPCLLSIIIYLMMYYPIPIKNRPEDMPIIFLEFGLVFIFCAVVNLNFENISQYYQLRQDKKIMLIQADMQKKEYFAIMDKVNSIQIYRHDMRHNIAAVNALLQDNNIHEAQIYLGRLNDNLSKTVIVKYCGNYYVNAILSSYINKAKSEQIEVISQIVISESIKIDNVDIGSVFANAIENATNACKKIEKPSDRKLSIVCKGHCDQLYIQISNTFVGKVLFDGEYPVSDSTDYTGHGIGTRSIAAIAEKYGGVFSFTAQDGIFKATVIL